MQDGQSGKFDQPSYNFESFPTINDERIITIPVHDNHDPLVNIFDIDEKFKQRLLLPQDPRLAFHRDDLTNTTTPLLRQEVVRKLTQVLDKLPDHIGMVIIEPYRSKEFQKQLFDQKVEELISKGIGTDTAKEQAATYVSNPDIYSPHVTGGTLDIGLVNMHADENNKLHYLDMGNNFEPTPSAHMNVPGLTEVQKQHRQLLTGVMEAVGFVNYPYEWWHWSYGDNYWAFIKKEPQAIYGSVETP